MVPGIIISAADNQDLSLALKMKLANSPAVTAAASPTPSLTPLPQAVVESLPPPTVPTPVLLSMHIRTTAVPTKVWKLPTTMPLPR